MSTTLRWSLVIIAAGMIGLALLLGGVVLGRATGGVTGYEPADAMPNTYGPAGVGSGPDATLAPPAPHRLRGWRARGAGVNESFSPGMMEPSIIDGNSGPGMAGPGTTLAPELC